MEREHKPHLSVYRILVAFVWVALALASVYLMTSIPLGLSDAKRIRPMLGAGLWSPGIVLGLQWESLSPDQWRSFCMSVYSWNLVDTLSLLIAVDQIRKMLGKSQETSPFTAENAGHVRNAGIAVLCAAAAKALRDLSFGRFILANVTIPGITVGFSSDLGLSTAFVGLMILTVAEVMRHGVRLQEEQDLTI